jgi:glutamate-1-semialdehyde 2,1-aminomutase
MDLRQSMKWLRRAVARTPDGSQTMSKAPARFVEGASPAFASHGQGALVWDVDGNGFIDWIAGQGVLTLGHAHPVIVEAVQRQLRNGTIFSLPHTLECEAAERLCAIVPCARGGMVRWTKTGSEACAGAVRLARIVTQRSIVMVASPGYHGWHDWFAVTQPYADGIPDAFQSAVVTFPFGDAASFEEALTAIGPDQVAAVITEPAREGFPPVGFLEHLRRRTSEIGALLVFDELRLGFRLAVGGGQEHFGIIPDLATFGKSLGGGLPLAAIVGPASIMRHAHVISGTFNGDCLSLAAAIAVMDLCDREPVIERVWRAGSKFVEVFTAACGGLPVRCVGLPVNPLVRWDDGTDAFRSLFVQEMARQGVLVHSEAIYPTAVLDEPQLVASMGALELALAQLHTVADEADARSRLDGIPCRPAFRPTRGRQAGI